MGGQTSVRLPSHALPPRLGRCRVRVSRPSIYPRTGFMMPFVTAFVFDEARRTFVNGDFVATILLAAAFIEHRLASHLRSKGYVKAARQGLAQMIACARQHDFASPFLLDKVDRLRRIRSPFVHLKPFEHDDGLLERMIRGAVEEPARLLEKDAKAALSLMYTMAV